MLAFVGSRLHFLFFTYSRFGAAGGREKVSYTPDVFGVCILRRRQQSEEGREGERGRRGRKRTVDFKTDTDTDTIAIAMNDLDQRLID